MAAALIIRRIHVVVVRSALLAQAGAGQEALELLLLC
jgi:hypothetical protein